MSTNQSFIGAYARSRRGGNPVNTPSNHPTPPEAVAPETTDPQQSVENNIESLEYLLGQSMSVADTYVAPSEVWVSQPEGQVLRFDRPAAAVPESHPVEHELPVKQSTQASEIAEPVFIDNGPAVDAEPVETTPEIAAPLRSQPVQSQPVVEVPAEPERRVDQTAAPKPKRWAGATWEVDAFDIPHSVAELFFDEAFFRSIAQHMGDSVRDGLRSVLVTSIAAGEGRSTVAIGTAIAAAATGIRVALVDVDLQSANQHEMLRLDAETDWVTAIRRGEPLENAAIVSLEDGVTLLPLILSQTHSLPVTPTELDQLIAKLAGCFDLVMFDGPVIRSWATARIASAVDSSLIIRDARSTSKSDVALAADHLRKQGVRGIGVVDNFCG